MIFHCLGVPHTITSRQYSACAYTAKILKFIKMMTARGHTCIHYGHPDSEVECENVPVVNRETWNRCYASNDTINSFFQFSMEDEAYKESIANAITEIGRRCQNPNEEFILSFFGWPGKEVFEAHPDMIDVEPGIGYSSGHPGRYKIFESYSLAHEFFGLENSGTAAMPWHWSVVPNYFDLEDFEYRSGGDYLLFMGRIYEGKGVHLVIQAAEHLPHIQFKLAGQNRSYVDDNYGPGKPNKLPENVEVVGFADYETRKNLYRDAKGVLCLSKFLEPFGGVAVEAMLSGTPVISVDWGAFTETVQHGHTGYRVRSFEQLLFACRNIDRIDPDNCRTWAQNYSLDAIAPRYEEAFQLFQQMHMNPESGWYDLNDSRTELNHMTLAFPSKPERQNFDWMEHEEGPFAQHLASIIKEQLKPDIAGDIGCGPGHFVRALESVGIQVRGFDIDERIHGKQSLRILDCSKYRLGASGYDLILCLEVAEHMPMEEARELINNIAQSLRPGGTLIWSAAQPGQTGVGHINCQSRDAWIALLERAGLPQDHIAERSLMQAVRDGPHMGWFASNAVVARKPGL